MALGATQQGIQWLILRESSVLVLSGIALGIPAALLAGKGMGGLLFGLSVVDPQTLTGATAVVLIVTVLASSIPARRASRVDPIVALRSE